eukprot:Gb_34272 [translate_table: standard]
MNHRQECIAFNYNLLGRASDRRPTFLHPLLRGPYIPSRSISHQGIENAVNRNLEGTSVPSQLDPILQSLRNGRKRNHLSSWVDDSQQYEGAKASNKGVATTEPLQEAYVVHGSWTIVAGQRDLDLHDECSEQVIRDVEAMGQDSNSRDIDLEFLATLPPNCKKEHIIELELEKIIGSAIHINLTGEAIECFEKLVLAGYHVLVVEKIGTPDQLDQCKEETNTKDKVMKKEICVVITKGTMTEGGITVANASTKSILHQVLYEIRPVELIKPCGIISE